MHSCCALLFCGFSLWVLALFIVLCNVFCCLFSQQIESGKQLEAFSIQLVILAIWKQALHICHTQAASAMEGSPSQETARFRRSTSKKCDSPDTMECLDAVISENLSSQIEREFLREVEHAEELAKAIEPGLYFIYSIL